MSIYLLTLFECWSLYCLVLESHISGDFMRDVCNSLFQIKLPTLVISNFQYSERWLFVLFHSIYHCPFSFDIPQFIKYKFLQKWKPSWKYPTIQLTIYCLLELFWLTFIHVLSSERITSLPIYCFTVHPIFNKSFGFLLVIFLRPVHVTQQCIFYFFNMHYF